MKRYAGWGLIVAGVGLIGLTGLRVYPVTREVWGTWQRAKEWRHHVAQLMETAWQGVPTDAREWLAVWDEAVTLQPELVKARDVLRQPPVRLAAKLAGKEAMWRERVGQIDLAQELGGSMADLRPALLTLLGYESRQHYVVLLQNNAELWPTGGYLGSYAEFWLDRGALKDLKFEAIDVPNGQIKGYVESPTPIVKYTHQGGTPGWRLRESNWEPDFPVARKTIEWFFVEGEVKPIDTMIATNLITVTDVLRVSGPLSLPDYNLTVTADTFFQEAESYSEVGFFDGSTQKRDFLGHAGRQLLRHVMDRPGEMMPRFLPVLMENLQTKQIMISANEATTAAWLKARGWDGSLWPVGCQGNAQCVSDYLHVNEANLGINKTNCCLDRQFSDEIRVTGEGIVHRLRMTFVNHNPETPDPPREWGGGYQAYTRLYVPAGTDLSGISREGVPVTEDVTVENNGDKTVVGFLVTVPGKQAATYEVEYTVPVTPLPYPSGNYQLAIQKQSGIRTIPWEIQVRTGTSEKIMDLSVDRDRVVNFDLP